VYKIPQFIPQLWCHGEAVLSLWCENAGKMHEYRNSCQSNRKFWQDQNLARSFDPTLLIGKKGIKLYIELKIISQFFSLDIGFKNTGLVSTGPFSFLK